MKKLTIHDILQLKGKRQIAEIFTNDPLEAAAAQEAGIEMITTVSSTTKVIRNAAPHVFLIVAPVPLTRFDPSNEVAIRTGQESMDEGADAIYCGCDSMERIAAMARVRIPIIGHVGFIPYRSNWIGGARAFGKSATEALELYQRTKAYENAGAIGVEMELVPDRIAAEISKRTKICVISMGSGPGCDGQYLFSCDMLGTNKGHVPRHAKQYVNLRPEYDRLHTLMTDAFGQFRQEVAGGGYPESRHSIKVQDDQLAKFIAGLDA